MVGVVLAVWLSCSVGLPFNGVVGFGFGFGICGFAVLVCGGVVLLVFACVGLLVGFGSCFAFSVVGVG